MAPFFAGIGPKEMSDVANILDLPNPKHLKQTISCHQPEIYKAIIKMSERETRIPMSEEIRMTIIIEKEKNITKND